MEDEECLPENSSLNLYLQDLGYSDLQVTKNTPQSPTSIRFEVAKTKSKSPFLETVDEDVIDQISIIISTQMLFEEDVSNVEKLLSNFKVVKTGVFKSMFKDFFGVAVIFLGLCFYWVIGYYAFFIVSSFYAFTAADYLSRKYKHRTRLKKLTSILQANFTLLRKTVKFIEENRLIEANNAFTNNSVEFLEGFDFYKNFKSDFLISIKEVINVLIKSTQKLIKGIPLYDYIENPEYYLCNNFSNNYESSDLSKLYEIYLLVQSEFLQRLILSLIPNIKLSPKDGFCELNKILTEACISLLKIKNKLNKKFKFIFLNGIHSPKTKVEFKLPLKNISQNNYFNEFMLNIHETSKTFQNLLLKCRTLEENLVLEKIPEYIEEELAKIQADLTACQRNIADSFILLKKSNYITVNPEKDHAVKIQKEEEVENSFERLNKIMVGYTELDPKIEDEIFEAYFSGENFVKDMSDIESYMDEKLEKKLEREYCKNVMKELKLKLVEKAKYWRKREKELLKKKGITDEKEGENSDVEVEVEEEKDYLSESCNDDEKITLKSHKIYENFEGNSEGPVEMTSCKTDRTDSDNLSIKLSQEKSNLQIEIAGSENIQIIGGFNRGFLDDLNQARQKIFKSSSAVEEELFCTFDWNVTDLPTFQQTKLKYITEKKTNNKEALLPGEEKATSLEILKS